MHSSACNPRTPAARSGSTSVAKRKAIKPVRQRSGGPTTSARCRAPTSATSSALPEDSAGELLATPQSSLLSLSPQELRHDLREAYRLIRLLTKREQATSLRVMFLPQREVEELKRQIARSSALLKALSTRY